MPITFSFFLFQLNLITFNYAVLFFNYVYIFPTKAHPTCTWSDNLYRMQ